MRIILVTALKAEAKPFIANYCLKKDMTSSAFPIYHNKNLSLIISGTGKIRSAMAATLLLSRQKNDGTLLVNPGICGAAASISPLSEVFSVHKVTDADTNRDYYPDLYPESVPESRSLFCFSTPVFQTDRIEKNIPESALVDMESAGIMEASEHFLFAQQVLLLKIPSDYLTPKKLDPQLPERLIDSQFSVIHQAIQQQWNALPKEDERLSEILSHYDAKGRELRFSNAMNRQLEMDVRFAYAQGKNPLISLAAVSPAENITKEEGKRIFADLRKELRQTVL